MVGSGASLVCTTFGRRAYLGNGRVDRTHESKGYEDRFGEEHDVEITKFVEKKSSSRLSDGTGAGVDHNAEFYRLCLLLTPRLSNSFSFNLDP